MPYTISAGVTVSPFNGVQSVNLNISPQIQRLFVLGSFTAFDKIVITQSTLSVTVYSPGPNLSVPPNTDCAEAAGGINVTITDTCGSAGGGGTFYCTSYSYTKDAQSWGTESFSFITSPIVEGIGGGPLTLIRGVPEGQATDATVCGVSFVTNDANGNFLEVSAGSPGIGRADTITFGEVSAVGGGIGKQLGVDGSANVTIPYTPIYI